MLKRLFHINLLLFATIFYLAQAILPHHHHDEELICIEKTHCETEEPVHLHGPGHHEHENNESDDDCTLERIVVITKTQKIQKAKNKFENKITKSVDAIPIAQLTLTQRHYLKFRFEVFKLIPSIKALWIQLPSLRGPPIF